MSENKFLRDAKPVPVIGGKIFWNLSEDILPIPKERVLICLQKSFDIISADFGDIRFQSTNDPKNASIQIQFKPSEFFSNPIILGQASPFTDQPALLTLNASREWSEFHKPGQFNMVKVLVHELLHTLGISHSTDPRCVMFKIYQDTPDIFISESTRWAIHEFYGLSYDLKLITDWLKECDFIYSLNDRDVLTLGRKIGLKLNPSFTKQYNIRAIKKRLGI